MVVCIIIPRMKTYWRNPFGNRNNPERKPASASEDTKEKRPKKENFFLEVVKFTVLSIAIVLPIRLYVAQPFIVSGSSMDPTFANGQYLIIDQISYNFHEPKRGDIIVFRYPRDPAKFFIKRIIGLPGDTIVLKENEVIVKNSENPEGFVLDENFVQQQRKYEPKELIMGEEEYFVMGDNRDSSSDSRYWDALPKSHIVGRAFLRILPTEQAAIFPGSYQELYQTP